MASCWQLAVLLAAGGMLAALVAAGLFIWVDSMQLSYGDCSSRFQRWMTGSRRRWQEKRAKTPKGMVGAIFASAALAECVAAILTPDFTVHGTGTRGALCNLVGFSICGVMASLGALGPKWFALARVMNWGYVGALTSFAGAVEDTVNLRCSGNDRDLIYLSSLFVGGPLCFTIARKIASVLLNVLGIKGCESREEVSGFLRQVAFVVSACVVAMIAWQQRREGSTAAAELAAAVAFTVAACPVGFVLAAAFEELFQCEPNGEFNKSVNWSTIGANAVAMLLLGICEVTGGAFDREVAQLGLGATGGWVLNVLAHKYRSNFVSMTSAYAGYSEDAVNRGPAEASAGNFGLNAAFGILAVAGMSHLRCGSPLFSLQA